MAKHRYWWSPIFCHFHMDHYHLGYIKTFFQKKHCWSVSAWFNSELNIKPFARWPMNPNNSRALIWLLIIKIVHMIIDIVYRLLNSNVCQLDVLRDIHWKKTLKIYFHMPHWCPYNCFNVKIYAILYATWYDFDVHIKWIFEFKKKIVQ